MEYSKDIKAQLDSFFAANNIAAAFEEKNDVGLFSFKVKLQKKIQNCRCLIVIREDNYSVIASLPLQADENHRLAVAEYLTRANFNLRDGNFELNMADGEIRYKSYVHSGGQPLAETTIKNSVFIPIIMFDRFGDGLLEVLFDFKTPKEAFEGVFRQTNG